MELRFKPDTHSYHSINDPNKKWVSVTKLISKFKEPFDAQKVAEYVSKKTGSRWYGMEPAKIIEFWNKETDRAVTLGTWYHGQREQETLSYETIGREGLEIPIFSPIMDGEDKLSPDQVLVEGIYPEHFMYLKSAGLCGQADRVEIIGDTIDIYDYKTNKKIELKSYVNRHGESKKMQAPLEHLDDCNLIHYALQLSFYMHMILKHNHNLKPGRLIIHHISFEKEGEDQFGFPIVKLDEYNNPIIKDITPYEVPYLKDEVNQIITFLKLNPNLLTDDKTV